MNIEAELQLVDENKAYNPQVLRNAICSLKSESVRDYAVIAIIGVQNSGKSTLLNALFQTQFKVLSARQMRRTTRGIHLATLRNMLVMDVEGNDSQEQVGDPAYEKMIASFALLTSNILMVNIMAKSLGQEAGSQYAALRVTLEICLEQFKRESPKAILYVIRDFNDKNYNQGVISQRVRKDVEDIWGEIQKPQQYRRISSDKFFTLDVAFLRKNTSPQFATDVNKLRQRLMDAQHPQYLLSKHNIENNLPIQDFQPLVEKAWKDIVENKALNMPAAKEQLASYRCNDILEDTKGAFQKQLTQLQVSSKQKSWHSSINYSNLLHSHSQQFLRRVNYYSKPIAEQKHTQLSEWMQQKIISSIRSELSVKVSYIESTFQELIMKRLARAINREHRNFREELSGEGESLLGKLMRSIDEMGYQFAERKETIERVAGELERCVQDGVRRREVQCEECFKREIERAMQLLAMELLRDSFGVGLWGAARDRLNAVSHPLISRYQEEMEWCSSRVVTAEALDRIQMDIHTDLVSIVKRELSRTLLDRTFGFFKQSFQVGRSNTEEQIAIAFNQAKEKTFELVREVNAVDLQKSMRTSVIEGLEENDTLFDSGWHSAHEEQLEKKMIHVYETTLRRKKQSQMKRLPLVLILIIAFFIYDDLWYSENDSPILHYSIILVGCFVVLALIFGQRQTLELALQIAWNKISRLFDRRQNKDAQYNN